MPGPLIPLVVEEDPQTAQLLLLLLAAPRVPSAPFFPRCAPDFHGALAALARGPRVDAVLLSLSAGGWRGLRAIRAAAPGVPIVALAGPERHDLGREALRRGAQDYQLKGRLDAGVLQAAIRRSVLLNKPAAATL